MGFLDKSLSSSVRFCRNMHMSNEAVRNEQIKAMIVCRTRRKQKPTGNNHLHSEAETLRIHQVKPSRKLIPKANGDDSTRNSKMREEVPRPY